MSIIETEEKTKSTPLVWSVIMLHMLNHVISGAMPILYPDIMNEFSLSYSQLGLIRSAATFSAGFPQMFVKWQDTHRPRKHSQLTDEHGDSY